MDYIAQHASNDETGNRNRREQWEKRKRDSRSRRRQRAENTKASFEYTARLSIAVSDQCSMPTVQQDRIWCCWDRGELTMPAFQDCSKKGLAVILRQLTLGYTSTLGTWTDSEEFGSLASGHDHGRDECHDTRIGQGK